MINIMRNIHFLIGFAVIVAGAILIPISQITAEPPLEWWRYDLVDTKMFNEDQPIEFNWTFLGEFYRGLN